MSELIRLLRRLFCRHRVQTFVRNIYGDEIIEWGWKRSLWRCDRCGALIAHLGLQPENRECTQ